PGATGETRIRVLQGPGIAAIVGAVQTCLLRLDECVNAFTICGNVDADASPITFRQTSVEPRPCLAGILGAVQAATRSVDRSIGAPWRTMRIPRARKQELRVPETNRQVGIYKNGTIIYGIDPVSPS